MDEKKLLDIIAEFTTYEPNQLEEEMNFVDDLGIDSLDLAQIILSAESEFNVELDDDIIENVETVGQAIELLKSQFEEE